MDSQTRSWVSIRRLWRRHWGFSFSLLGPTSFISPDSPSSPALTPLPCALVTNPMKASLGEDVRRSLCSSTFLGSQAPSQFAPASVPLISLSK